MLYISRHVFSKKNTCLRRHANRHITPHAYLQIHTYAHAYEHRIICMHTRLYSYVQTNIRAHAKPHQHARIHAITLLYICIQEDANTHTISDTLNRTIPAKRYK